MRCIACWTAFRFIVPVLIGLLLAPVSGASTIATAQQEQRAMHGNASQSPAVGESGADRERLQQIALMVSADANDISRNLLTRFPPASVQASRTEPEMGLQLPEPGPLSAIIATLALAGFVLIRRIV